jgi:ABC-type antimicrobial peptide transport system permease subunit
MMDPGGPDVHRDWHPRSVLAVVGCAVLVGLVIGLVAIGPLGTSGDSRGVSAALSTTPQTTTVTGASTFPVSLELHTKKLVWVCLLDQRKRPLINGLNLIADQTVGPYSGRAFTVSLGNGSIDLEVDGMAVEIPRIAAPLGYRITPEGATRLPPSEQPSCT